MPARTRAVSKIEWAVAWGQANDCLMVYEPHIGWSISWRAPDAPGMLTFEERDTNLATAAERLLDSIEIYQAGKEKDQC
jgi:hypothetical protein